MQASDIVSPQQKEGVKGSLAVHQSLQEILYQPTSLPEQQLRKLQTIIQPIYFFKIFPIPKKYIYISFCPRIYCLQQIVKESEKEVSVNMRQTCREEGEKKAVTMVVIHTRQLHQYEGNHKDNNTARKRKPVAKCSDKLEIYHHPSSSIVPLQKEIK